MDHTTDFEYFNTLMVHNVGNRIGPIAPVMAPSAAFGYESAEEAEGIFSGEVAKPLYARVGNPTNAKLVITSYSIHYTKLYEWISGRRGAAHVVRWPRHLKKQR